MPKWSLADDLAMRKVAMEWLSMRTHDGIDSITRDELAHDFYYRGERIRLISTQQGIWKPVFLNHALAIVTTYSAPGAARPYDDVTGEDKLHRYKWREHGKASKRYGESAYDHAENVALRRAWEDRVPVIWYWGVAPGVYTPIYPVYVIDEEVERHQFVIGTDGMQNFESAGVLDRGLPKEYRDREVRQRIHQPVFRALVMEAYETRCAVCALRHSSLLDAAHIVPDRDDAGIAAVRNGLALCKIHHAAYDSGILGVSPDRTVAIREDILDEVDGPILEHGLKQLNGEKLRVVPRQRANQPDRELLERQFQQFKRNSVGRIDLAAAPHSDGRQMEVRVDGDE